jgi:hypothetical protein
MWPKTCSQTRILLQEVTFLRRDFWIVFCEFYPKTVSQTHIFRMEVTYLHRDCFIVFCEFYPKTCSQTHIFCKAVTFFHIDFWFLDCLLWVLFSLITTLTAEPEFVNILRSPGINSQPAGRDDNTIWCTGPPGYIGWWNRFLGIDSSSPETFTNSGSDFVYICLFSPSVRWSQQWGK